MRPLRQVESVYVQREYVIDVCCTIIIKGSETWIASHPLPSVRQLGSIQNVLIIRLLLKITVNRVTLSDSEFFRQSSLTSI